MNWDLKKNDSIAKFDLIRGVMLEKEKKAIYLLGKEKYKLTFTPGAFILRFWSIQLKI